MEIRVPRRRTSASFRQRPGRDGVLEEGLDARHQHAGRAAAPCREGGHPGGRFVADELGALEGEGGARLEHRDRTGVAQPGLKFLRDAVGDLGVRARPRRGARRWPA